MLEINLKKGFTLLEALVAISILMVAVVAPITIAQKGLSSATYIKNQMIASYLAQDAIEYIKNELRAFSKNNASDWGLGTTSPPYYDNTLIKTDCLVDTIDTANTDNEGCQVDTILEAVSSYDSTKTLLKNSNGFYGYPTTGSSTTTPFTRQVQIKLDPNNSNEDEALLTATVRWGTDKVMVETLIYNY